jgi:hypothetical protein
MVSILKLKESIMAAEDARVFAILSLVSSSSQKDLENEYSKLEGLEDSPKEIHLEAFWDTLSTYRELTFQVDMAFLEKHEDEIRELFDYRFDRVWLALVNLTNIGLFA